MNPNPEPLNPSNRLNHESAVPVVYAHRGGSALRPENTIPAFDHGLSLGADGLELDVHLSRDGVVVVHHDPTLERTTNGRGPLAALTADELARLDAGSTSVRLRRRIAAASADSPRSSVPRAWLAASRRFAEVLQPLSAASR